MTTSNDVMTDAQRRTRTLLKTMGWVFNLETIQKGLVRFYQVNEMFIGGATKVQKILVAEVHPDGRINQVLGD